MWIAPLMHANTLLVMQLSDTGQQSISAEDVSNFCQQRCTNTKYNHFGLFWTFYFEQFFSQVNVALHNHVEQYTVP